MRKTDKEPEGSRVIGSDQSRGRISEVVRKEFLVREFGVRRVLDIF
jgi:hypothetical protein